MSGYELRPFQYTDIATDAATDEDLTAFAERDAAKVSAGGIDFVLMRATLIYSNAVLIQLFPGAYLRKTPTGFELSGVALSADPLFRPAS